MSGRARYVTRAVFLAAVLVLAVGWALWSRPAAVVATAPEQGRVISVQERFGVVEIADGRRVRLFLPTPAPRPGDTVPLLMERHADGKVLYRIDTQAWRGSAAR